MLVHPDGFETLQNLAHLRPSFEHPGRRLERPQASVNVWGISGMSQHPCADLAYEGVLRRSHRASVDGIMLAMERRSLYRRIGSMLRERRAHRMERSEELQDLVRASFEVYSTGGTSFIDRYTSSQDGVRLKGSDPNEWFEGEQVAGVLKQEMQAGDVTVSSTGEVDAFVEGNVGWVSSRPVWFLEDGTEIPTRSTAIFHREDGEWKMAQGPHFSRVSNEELFGE